MMEPALTTFRCAMCQTTLTEFETHICGSCSEDIETKGEENDRRFGV